MGISVGSFKKKLTLEVVFKNSFNFSSLPQASELYGIEMTPRAPKEWCYSSFLKDKVLSLARLSNGPLLPKDTTGTFKKIHLLGLCTSVKGGRECAS